MLIDFMMMFSCVLNAIPCPISGATDIKRAAALFSSGMLAGGLGVNAYFRSSRRLITRETTILCSVFGERLIRIAI